jgi:hypothetical protein
MTSPDSWMARKSVCPSPEISDQVVPLPGDAQDHDGDRQADQGIGAATRLTAAAARTARKQRVMGQPVGGGNSSAPTMNRRLPFCSS